jgi:RNA polymerase sigma-70 factor (ECF subfamily)
MAEQNRRDEAVQAAAQSAPTGPPSTALAAIFEQHHGAIFRAAYRVTGNAMDAEDVLQTVFIRLLRRQDEIDLSASAASYLHRAAVNASLDLLRSRKRAGAVALDDVADHLVDTAHRQPDDQSANRDLSRQLRQAISQLSPRQAEIFSLRYLEGLGNHEIAELLGTSQTAIAVLLHRARRRLQRELRPSTGDPS